MYWTSFTHYPSKRAQKIAWGLILIISLTMFFTVYSLHRASQDISKQELALERIRSSIHKLAALQWEAQSKKNLSPKSQKIFLSAKNRINTNISFLLKAGNDANLKKVLLLLRDYNVASIKEFNLLNEKNFKEAELFDKNTLSPKLNNLETKARAISNSYSLKAQRFHVYLNLGIIISALIYTLSLTLLIIYLQRVTDKAKISEARENALKQSEERFKSIIKNSSDIIMIIDKDGIIKYVSSSCSSIIDCSETSLIEKNIIAVFGDHNQKELLRLLETCNLNIDEHVEAHVEKHQDSTQYLRILAKNMFSDKNIEGIVLNIRDVTKYVHYQWEISEREKFLANIFSSIQDLVCVTDTDKTIIQVNAKTERMYADKIPLVGKKCYEVFYNSSTPCQTCYSDCTITSALPTNKLTSLTDSLGNEIFFDNFAFPFIDSDSNKVKGVIHYSRDVSEKYKLEKEMARFESLNLIGEIAASIAHEIRNPMTTVRGFLQLTQVTNEQLAQENLNIMIDELDRANSIITEFLSLAKNRSIEVRKQSLNKIIKTLAPLIKADALSSGKNIAFNLTHELPELDVDEKEIRQLILNLVRNGLEATPEGKKIQISTYLENNNVVFSVKDEGKGIDSWVLERLGTPFVTTKDNGTGLGLAVCYSIASKHNAIIDIDTSPAGTTFSVKFKLG